jgi:hypothetical protein
MNADERRSTLIRVHLRLTASTDNRSGSGRASFRSDFFVFAVRRSLARALLRTSGLVESISGGNIDLLLNHRTSIRIRYSTSDHAAPHERKVLRYRRFHLRQQRPVCFSRLLDLSTQNQILLPAPAPAPFSRVFD